jgi:hypothetical protein
MLTAKKIDTDIFKWWYSPETQKARKSFCDEFTISDKEILKTWVKFFIKK